MQNEVYSIRKLQNPHAQKLIRLKSINAKQVIKKKCRLGLTKPYFGLNSRKLAPKAQSTQDLLKNEKLNTEVGLMLYF